MFVALGVVIAVVLGAICRLARNRRRHRLAARDPAVHVFQSREMQELDAILDLVAVDERRRLDADVLRYVAGEAGHVVVVSDWRYGIALELSDGRRIALGGVSRVTRRLLAHRVSMDKLRLARVECDGISYRLTLRGEAGDELEIFSRRVALAP
jgi:hypothetical protein